MDLGIEIMTALPGAEVLAAHHASGNREYERLLVADMTEVAARVASEGGRLVELADAFLNRAGVGAS